MSLLKKSSCDLAFSLSLLSLCSKSINGPWFIKSKWFNLAVIIHQAPLSFFCLSWVKALQRPNINSRTHNIYLHLPKSPTLDNVFNLDALTTRMNRHQIHYRAPIYCSMIGFAMYVESQFILLYVIFSS